MLTRAQDLLPTLLDLCGLGPPEELEFRGLDGVSLDSVLRGRPEALRAGPRGRILVVQYATRPSRRIRTEWFGDPTERTAAVLWQRWRLIAGRELYDLERDPGQTTGVAGAHPEVVARLRARYRVRWEGIAPAAFELEHAPLGSAGSGAPAGVELTPHMWLEEPVAATFGAGPNNVSRSSRGNGPRNARVERAGAYEIAPRRWPQEATAPTAGGNRPDRRRRAGP